MEYNFGNISHIIKSYDVGQYKQMVEQIDDYGIYGFLTDLETTDNLDDYKVKFEILKIYLKIKTSKE